MINQPTPTQPPGIEGFLTILDWTSWIAIFICFAMFLIAAARIGIAYHQGEVEGLKGAVLAIVGTVLVGGASAIFQAVS